MQRPLVHPMPKFIPPKQRTVLRPSHNGKWRKMKKRVISLRVNSEEKETIIHVFVNFSDQDFKEVYQEDAENYIEEAEFERTFLKEFERTFHNMKTQKNVGFVYVYHVSQMKIIDVVVIRNSFGKRTSRVLRKQNYKLFWTIFHWGVIMDTRFKYR